MKDASNQDLIEALGINNFPEQEQEKMAKKMSEVLFKRVITKTFDYLSDEDADEINALFEKQEEEQAFKLLEEKVTNLDDIFEQEIEKLREELIKKI